jgi:hypothetical protein
VQHGTTGWWSLASIATLAEVDEIDAASVICQDRCIRLRRGQTGLWVGWYRTRPPPDTTEE